MEVILLTVIFLLLQIQLTPCSSTSPQMDPNRKQFIKELITSMNLRRYGIVLDDAVVQAIQDKIHQMYFEDPDKEDSDSLYRKFVLSFDTLVKPRLILNHGDACDPAYTNQYKYPDNHLITDISLWHWVSQHVANTSTGQAEVSSDAKYCDFRRGLFCSSSSSKCECPPGASYMDADDPTRYLDKYCFIPPNEKCYLIDTKNSEDTLGSILNRLPYLIFNPERPLSCSPGTQCRMKWPFLRIPRCWCVDQTTNPECSNAKLYWPLDETVASTLPSESLNLAEMLMLAVNSTFGHERRYRVYDREDRSWYTIGRHILPETRTQYEMLRSIDDVGAAGVDVGVLKGLKSRLEESSKDSCWVDLIPEFECGSKRTTEGSGKEDTRKYFDMYIYTKCVLKPDTGFAEEHGKFWKPYGASCLVGLEDVEGSCDPRFVCHRWDKTSTEGVCYCPAGYGWASRAWDHEESDWAPYLECRRLDDSEFPKRKISIANFVHPATVAVRGKDLAQIQSDLNVYDQNIYWGRKSWIHGTDLGDKCPLQKEVERAEAYTFFASLQEKTLTDAANSGLDKRTVEEKMRPIREAFSTRDNFCDRKHGFVCVADPTGANPREDGVCKEISSPVPDAYLIEKNPLIKKWNEKVQERHDYIIQVWRHINYNVETVKEMDCVVAPTPHGRSGGGGDVDENGECLKGNICMENYSTLDALQAVWEVTKADGTKATVTTSNEKEPLMNMTGETTVLKACNVVTSPPKTVCHCLYGNKYRNDYKYDYDYEDYEPEPEPDLSGGVSGYVCPDLPRNYTPCEKQIMEEKAKVLTSVVMSASALNGGMDCNQEGEKYVGRAIKRSEVGSKEFDFYQVVGNLRMALRRSTSFCDRTKLLVCGQHGKCECGQGTDFRRTRDGVQSQYCYVTQGSCKQDVTTLAQMFAIEKEEAGSHYGSLGDTDESGCVKNLCAQVDKSSLTCVPGENFVVFGPAPPPTVMGPGYQGPRPGLNGNGDYDDDEEDSTSAGLKLVVIWEALLVFILYLLVQDRMSL